MAGGLPVMQNSLKTSPKDMRKVSIERGACGDLT
jgi:hypothetical protein